MEIKRKDVLICGVALFAIFFGAGNLIFPPYLGILAGDRWYEAMFAFLLCDPVLPIWGVIVTAWLGGGIDDLGRRVGLKFARLVEAVAILMIGPLFCVPRTGATTYELFLQPIFPSLPAWGGSLIFFTLTIYLSLNPNKVIDVIGRYLTPGLLTILALLVGVAVFNPPDVPVATATEHLFTLGFREGYQTMDALGSALMAGIVVADLTRRGYTDKRTRFKVSVRVGLIAFALLAIVYGSLTYAGATVGGHFNADTERIVLLNGMAELMLGHVGKTCLGLAVALACLTTSVGLTSTCGNFFAELSGGKLKYRNIAIVAAIVSFVNSLVGVDGLIAIAVPVLSAIYPVIIVLIMMSAFDNYIKYDFTYTGAVVGAFTASMIESIHLASVMRGGNFMSGLSSYVAGLPFGSVGFEWVLPAVTGSVLFTLLSCLSGIGGRRES